MKSSLPLKTVLLHASLAQQAPREQRHLVSAEEDAQAPARLPYSAQGYRRARTGPVGGDADHLHEFALAEADRPLPRCLYLYSPKGAQYTRDGLRARYGRWLADTPEGCELCRRWKEWVAAQVKKYDWDIDPDDADHPTIHGLRGTGILARAEQGYETDQIANDIGMSRQNVDHYMRFRDQVKTAEAGQKRLRLVAKED